jgi:hypothetical protein
MRVLSGALLEGCFVLGLLLVAALIALLRHSVWRFVKLPGGLSNPHIIPDPGFGHGEQLKRPAFLPGTADSFLRRG